MSNESKVRALVLSKVAPTQIEAEIGAIITAEEAGGFVLEDLKVMSDSIVLHFKNQSVLPGGGGLKFLERSFDFNDVAALGAATSGVLPFSNVPADITPIAATIDVNTAFVGTGITALTGSLGDTADPDGVMAAQDLLTLGVKGVGGGAYLLANQNSMAPEVAFSATGANLDQMTAGEAVARIYYIDNT